MIMKNYDRIILSSSGCYGSCPIMEVSISSNCEFYFYGKQYNTQNGFFKTKLLPKEFESIMNPFFSIDILNLENNYETNTTDLEAIYLTFVKDDKVVKSIMDYGASAPKELIWAYKPLRYFYQKLQLEQVEQNIVQLSCFKTIDQINKTTPKLSPSALFYLSLEILHEKKSDVKFTPKYEIKYSYWDKDVEDVILSDGQFFQFENRTMDIGYNFFERNDFNALSKK